MAPLCEFAVLGQGIWVSGHILILVAILSTDDISIYFTVLQTQRRSNAGCKTQARGIEIHAADLWKPRVLRKVMNQTRLSVKQLQSQLYAAVAHAGLKAGHATEGQKSVHKKA